MKARGALSYGVGWRGPGLTQKEGGLGGNQGGAQRPLSYGRYPCFALLISPKVPLCSPCPPYTVQLFTCLQSLPEPPRNLLS